MDILPSEITQLEPVIRVETELQIPQFTSTGVPLMEIVDWRVETNNPKNYVAVTEIKDQG
jgi:hypothetical protein